VEWRGVAGETNEDWRQFTYHTVISF
jgi:hypothetical protein